jgi:hypothetical protein
MALKASKSWNRMYEAWKDEGNRERYSPEERAALVRGCMGKPAIENLLDAFRMVKSLPPREDSNIHIGFLRSIDSASGRTSERAAREIREKLGGKNFFVVGVDGEHFFSSQGIGGPVTGDFAHPTLRHSRPAASRHSLSRRDLRLAGAGYRFCF